MTHKNKGPYEAHIKRPIDIIISLTILLLFCWVYLVIAIVVRIQMGSPVLFVQERTGRNGEPFLLYKFRSMSNKCDESGKLLPANQRLNKTGKLLRSLSLDELPEIYNILKGDMSLIGPRPLITEYYKHYNKTDIRRHEVRPGLTGLAQVSGRNAMTWQQKFKKDLEYVDNVSLIMDIKILLLTVKKVFAREGIEFESGHQSVLEYFEENKEG